jgi:hypothetical protein
MLPRWCVVACGQVASLAPPVTTLSLWETETQVYSALGLPPARPTFGLASATVQFYSWRTVTALTLTVSSASLALTDDGTAAANAAKLYKTTFYRALFSAMAKTEY